MERRVGAAKVGTRKARARAKEAKALMRWKSGQVATKMIGGMVHHSAGCAMKRMKMSALHLKIAKAGWIMFETFSKVSRANHCPCTFTAPGKKQGYWCRR